ncbi:hypothetical protein HG530_005785 [Fusarium avenaceum]|nr:hypothetical protein HG530_005785 [Fusarium avenaceum]
MEVGHCLRLNTLRRINQKQRTTAAGIRSRNFGSEIHMAGCIDKMQQIVLALVLVDHGTRLRLDGNTTFALNIELVENLLIRIASRYRARIFQQSIAQGAFPMVDMRHDTKVAVSLDRNRGNSSLKLGRRRFVIRRSVGAKRCEEGWCQSCSTQRCSRLAYVP